MNGIEDLAKLFAQRGVTNGDTGTGFLRDAGNTLSQLEGRNRALEAVIEEQALIRRQELQRQAELQREADELASRQRAIQQRATQIRENLISESFAELDPDEKQAVLNDPTGRTMLAEAARRDYFQRTSGNPDFDPTAALSQDQQDGLNAYGLAINQLTSEAASQFSTPQAFQDNVQQAQQLLDNPRLNPITDTLRSTGSGITQLVGGFASTAADVGTLLGSSAARALGVDEATIRQRAERQREGTQDIINATNAASDFIGPGDTLNQFVSDAQRAQIDPEADLSDRLSQNFNSIGRDDLIRGAGSLIASALPGLGVARGVQAARAAGRTGLLRTSPATAAGITAGAQAGLTGAGDVQQQLLDDGVDDSERVLRLLGGIGAQTALGAATANLGAFAPAQQQLIGNFLPRATAAASPTRSIGAGRLLGELGGDSANLLQNAGNVAIGGGRLAGAVGGRGVAGAVGEGLEEVAQTAIGNVAGGGLDNINQDGSLDTSFVLGSVFGTAPGAVSGARDRLASRAATVNQYPTRAAEIEARQTSRNPTPERPTFVDPTATTGTAGITPPPDVVVDDSVTLDDDPLSFNPPAASPEEFAQGRGPASVPDAVAAREDQFIGGRARFNPTATRQRDDAQIAERDDILGRAAAVRASTPDLTPNLTGISREEALANSPFANNGIVTAQEQREIDQENILARAAQNRRDNPGTVIPTPTLDGGITRGQAAANAFTDGIVSPGERREIAQEQIDRDIRNRGSIQPDITVRDGIDLDVLRDGDAAARAQAIQDITGGGLLTPGERREIAQEQVDSDIRNRGSIQPDIRESVADLGQLRATDGARAATANLQDIARANAARDVATGATQPSFDSLGNQIEAATDTVVRGNVAADANQELLEQAARVNTNLPPFEFDPRLQATPEAQRAAELAASGNPSVRGQADGEREAIQQRNQRRQQFRDEAAEPVVSDQQVAQRATSAQQRAAELARLEEAERVAAERAETNRARREARQAARTERQGRRDQQQVQEEPPNIDSLANGGVATDSAGNRYRIIERQNGTAVPQVFDPDANEDSGAFVTVPSQDGETAASFTYEDAVGTIEEHSAFNGGDGDLGINQPGNADADANDNRPAETPRDGPSGTTVLTANNQVQTVVEEGEPLVLATNANATVAANLAEAEFEGDVLLSDVATGNALVRRRIRPTEIPERLSSNRLRVALRDNGSDAFTFPATKNSQADVNAAVAAGLLYRTDAAGNPIPTRQSVRNGVTVQYAEGERAGAAPHNLGHFRFHPDVVAESARLGVSDNQAALQREIDNLTRLQQQQEDGDIQLSNDYNPSELASDYDQVLEESLGDVHETVVHIPRGQLNELIQFQDELLTESETDLTNTVPRIVIDNTGRIIGSTPTRLSIGSLTDTIPVVVESVAPLDGSYDFPVIEGVNGVEVDSFINGRGEQITPDTDPDSDTDTSEALDLLTGSQGTIISERDQPTIFQQAQELVRRGLAIVEQVIAPGTSGQTDNLLSRFRLSGANPRSLDGLPDAPNPNDNDTHYTTGLGQARDPNPQLLQELGSFFGFQPNEEITPQALADALVARGFGGVREGDSLRVATSLLNDMRAPPRIRNNRRRDQHIASMRAALNDSSIAKPVGLELIQSRMDGIASRYGIEAPVVTSASYIQALRDSGNPAYRSAAQSFALNTAGLNVRGAYNGTNNVITLQDSDLEVLGGTERGAAFNTAAFTAFHEHAHAIDNWIARESAANNPQETVDTLQAYLTDMAGRDLALRPAQISFTEWRADQVASMLLREEAGDPDAIAEIETPTTLIGRIAQAVRNLWDNYVLFYDEGTAPPLEAALNGLREREAARQEAARARAEQAPAAVQDTVLRDPTGNPQKLFRGEEVPAGTRRGDDSGRVFNNALGFMFTDDPLLADAYGGYRSGRVDQSQSSQYYADIKKPLVIDANGLAEFDTLTEESLALQSPATRRVLEQSGNTDLRINQALVEQARRYGFDGLVVNNFAQGLSTQNQRGTPRAGALETYVDQLRQRYATTAELDQHLDQIDPLNESALREWIRDWWANGYDNDPSIDLSREIDLSNTYVVFDKRDVFNPDGISINDRDTLTEGGEQEAGKKYLGRLSYLSAADHELVAERETTVERPKPVRRQHWLRVSNKSKQVGRRNTGLRVSAFSGSRDLPAGFNDQVLQSGGRIISNDTQSFVYGGGIWVNSESVSSDAEIQSTIMRQVLVHPELRAKHGPKKVDQLISKAIADAGGTSYVNSLTREGDIAAIAPDVNRSGILLLDGAATGDQVLVDAIETVDRAVLNYIKRSYPALLPAFEVMSPTSRIEVISGVPMMDGEAVQFFKDITPEESTRFADERVGPVLTDTIDTGFVIPSGKPGGRRFVSRTGVLGTTESIASAADRIKDLPKATAGLADIGSLPSSFVRSTVDTTLARQGFSARQLRNLNGLQKFNQYLKAVLKTPVREANSYYNRVIKQGGHDMRDLYVMEMRKQEKYKNPSNTKGLETLGEQILTTDGDRELSTIASALLKSMHDRNNGTRQIGRTPRTTDPKRLVDDFNENYQDRLNVFSHQDRAENITTNEHKEVFGQLDLDIQMEIRRIAAETKTSVHEARKYLNNMMRLFHTPEYIIGQVTTNPEWVNAAVDAMNKDVREAYDATPEKDQQDFLRKVLFDYANPGSNVNNKRGSYKDKAGNIWTVEHFDASFQKRLNEYAPMGRNYDQAVDAINELYDHRRDPGTGELLNKNAWPPGFGTKMQEAMAAVRAKSEAIENYAKSNRLTESRVTKLPFTRYQFPVNKSMQELDTYSVNPSGAADGMFEDVELTDNAAGMDPLEAQDKWAQSVILQKNLQPMHEAILASAIAARNNPQFNSISDGLYGEAFAGEGSISMVEVGSKEHEAILNNIRKSAANGYAGLDQMLVNLPFLESGGKRQTVHLRFQKTDGGSLVDKFVSDKKQSNTVTKLLNSRNPVIASALKYGVFKSKQLTGWNPEHILRSTFRDNGQVILSALAEDGTAAGGQAAKAVTDIHTYENTRTIFKYVQLDEAVGRSSSGAKKEFDDFVKANEGNKAVQNLLTLRRLGGIPEYNKQFTRNQDPGYLQELAERYDDTGAAVDKQKALIDTLDSVARTTDIMMRVSAFEASKVQGRSDQQASDFALGMAPFHRSGAHPYAPLFARAFMFFRSGVTGGIFNADQLLTARYNTEMAAAAFATGVTLFPLLAALAPDDDEGRNSFLAQGLADGNLSVWTPFSQRPANIPLPYIGSSGFFSTGINLMHSIAGQQSAGDALGSSLRSFTQTFSPFNNAMPLFDENGDFQPLQKAAHLFTPEFLRPALEQLTNTNGFGYTISYGSGGPGDAFNVSVNDAGDWIDQLSRGLAAVGLPPDQSSLRHHIQNSLPLLDNAIDFAFGWGNLLTGNQYNDVEDILWPFAAFIGSQRDAELSTYYSNVDSAQTVIKQRAFLSKFMSDQDIIASGKLTAEEIAYADYWKQAGGAARQRLGVAKTIRNNPTLSRNRDDRITTADEEYSVARDYILGTIMKTAREQFPDLVHN